MGRMLRTIGNETGAVLVMSLLILTILAVLSLTAIFTASQGLHMSADYKIYQQTLYNADGGTDFAYSVVKRTMANGMRLSSIDTGNSYVTIASTTTLESEINGTTVGSTDSVTSAPNISLNIMGDIVSIDIDYLKSKVMAGSSTESAARYEGIGSGSSGGVGIYYQIDAYNRALSGKSSTVRINFKCVEGGGRCL